MTSMREPIGADGQSFMVESAMGGLLGKVAWGREGGWIALRRGEPVGIFASPSEAAEAVRRHAGVRPDPRGASKVHERQGA